MPQLSELDELLIECYDKPGLFHEAVLGRPKFYPKQEEIARSVVENQYTIVPTAHAMGKTWAAPSSVLHWLYTRPGSMVVTTSPSNTQLVNALWGGIKRAFAGASYKLEGRISDGSGTPQLLTLEPKWYAIGWAAKKPESFQGQRPDGGELLVITDESSGIEQSIWDAIESLGATSHLILGNPIRARGHFRTLYDLATQGTPGYKAFNLSAFDSPYARLTDAEVKARGLAKGLVSKSWIEKTRNTYGDGSIYWLTRVLAKFPEEDFDQLVPMSWLDRCVTEARDTKLQAGPRSLAIDLSKGSGRDFMVAIVADYLGVLHIEANNTTDVLGAAQLVKRLSQRFDIPHHRIVYDAGGSYGDDMTTYLESLQIYGADPYRGGQGGGKRYTNRRMHSAWKFRQRLDPKRPRILPKVSRQRNDEDDFDRAFRAKEPTPPSDPPQPSFHIAYTDHWAQIRRELLEIRYMQAERKMKLEEKEDLQARIGHSPDFADTFFMLAATWEDE